MKPATSAAASAGAQRATAPDDVVVRALRSPSPRRCCRDRQSSARRCRSASPHRRLRSVAPTASAIVSVGWSLVPVIVIVTVVAAEAALPAPAVVGRHHVVREGDGFAGAQEVQVLARAVVPAVLVDREAGHQRRRQRRRSACHRSRRCRCSSSALTVTTSLVSRSAKLSAPLSVSVAAPSPSLSRPGRVGDRQRRLVVGAGDRDRHRGRRRGGIARAAVVGRHHVVREGDGFAGAQEVQVLARAVVPAVLVDREAGHQRRRQRRRQRAAAPDDVVVRALRSPSPRRCCRDRRSSARRCR